MPNLATVEDLPAHLLHRQNSSAPELWSLLDTVTDPEIPVVSIWDLGILHDISVDQETITVTITPTYSGCPAMHEISNDIKSALLSAGHPKVIVRTLNSHLPGLQTGSHLLGKIN